VDFAGLIIAASQIQTNRGPKEQTVMRVSQAASTQAQ
jgi:hypothetical protein